MFYLLLKTKSLILCQGAGKRLQSIALAICIYFIMQINSNSIEFLVVSNYLDKLI